VPCLLRVLAWLSLGLGRWFLTRHLARSPIPSSVSDSRAYSAVTLLNLKSTFACGRVEGALHPAHPVSLYPWATTSSSSGCAHTSCPHIGMGVALKAACTAIIAPLNL